MRILSVMYLPNEGALEKLQRADPDFVAKAAKREIIPVGPAGLAGLIGFASHSPACLTKIAISGGAGSVTSSNSPSMMLSRTSTR